ncbi:uncharacterized protein LOC144870893 [Branchiostoma floridae x Branchiostoma japonicum]
MDYHTGLATVTVVVIAATACFVARRLAARRPSWPKVKQPRAYKQKVAPRQKNGKYQLNSLDDFTPVGEKELVHDVPAFFTGPGTEFSVYSVDWVQESVVLIRPVDGTDLKKHPFFREAQRRNAAEVLLIPIEQLQTVVDVISDRIAHVQEVFVYNTTRCGSTLLARAVQATSVAQAVSEPQALDSIYHRLVMLRRRCVDLQSGLIPAILQNDDTIYCGAA